MSEGREHIYAQLREAGFDWPVLEIKRLQAEVAEYSAAMVTEERRAVAAEAKLAAIEGVQRYTEFDGYFDPYPEGEWIKTADIQTILRGAAS